MGSTEHHCPGLDKISGFDVAQAEREITRGMYILGVLFKSSAKYYLTKCMQTLSSAACSTSIDFNSNGACSIVER